MQEQNQVKIKRVTQSFEVCEVNGFVFKRRRQTIVPENAHPNQTHPALQQQHFQTPAAGHQMMHHTYNNHHPGYAPHHQQYQQQSNHNSYAPPSVSLNFDEYSISRELYQRLSLRLGALTEDATPAERLGAYVDAVCDAEQLSIASATNNNNGEGEKNPQMEAAVQDVLTMFRKSVVTALKMGTITCLDGPPSTPATGGKSGAGNNDPNDYDNDNDHYAHLEARKAGLRARLARFEEEEREWENLLIKVEEMHQELESQAAAALGYINDGKNNNYNNKNDMGEDGQQHQHQQQEEREKKDAEDVDPPEAKELRQLQADVHREVALQVEGLCMLVGDVEELADVADQSAHAMQAQYHAEKFKTFAHMDSPDRLIRDILRPTAVGRAVEGGVMEGEKEGKVDGDGIKEEEEVKP